MCPWCELKAGKGKSKVPMLPRKIHGKRCPNAAKNEPVVKVQFVRTQRRFPRISYEKKLFQQSLSAEEESEVAAMVEEEQKLQARVIRFCQTLPDACVPPTPSKLELPLAATVADVPLPMWNRLADRRFTRKFSMRGRARGNVRGNQDSHQDAASELEDLNYGQCSDFSEKARVDHCAYFLDEFGARVRAVNVFAGRGGSTVYLSRKERNRRQHALVGNTAPSADASVAEASVCEPLLTEQAVQQERQRGCKQHAELQTVQRLCDGGTQEQMTVAQVTAGDVFTLLHWAREYWGVLVQREECPHHWSRRHLVAGSESFALDACGFVKEKKESQSGVLVRRTRTTHC